MMNRFPVKNGVSTTISPEEIVEGKHKFNFSKRRITLGQYAQVWTGTNNTKKERSVYTTALHKSNENGGCYFMNLESGKQIHSYQWEELPITDAVIQRVSEL